jgi:hypothetical protein
LNRRLLDLFCGEGLAAWGYWQSGRFSEIVGMDINPKMSGSYAFDFLCGDCMALDYDFLMSFDFIHASPPCQAYSHITPCPATHPRLVAGVRHMLFAAGVPHCVENVQGAMKELRPNLTLDGHFVGLPMERRRYFYISSGAATHQLIERGTETVSIHRSQYVSRAELIRVFGLDTIPENRQRLLTTHGIKQGIAPAMTRYIASRFVGEKLLVS